MKKLHWHSHEGLVRFKDGKEQVMLLSNVPPVGEDVLLLGARGVQVIAYTGKRDDQDRPIFEEK